jgi:hypothetical protein
MLDIYLYRRNKKRKRITVKDSNKELVELLEKSPIKELRELKEYSQHIVKPFVECLKEAINNYVGVISGGVQSEEVSHSKGLWSVLCMFKDYTESCSNMVLKQYEVKELFDLVTKSLCDVERHFEDNGYTIISSPLNDTTNLLLGKDGTNISVINRGDYKDESDGKVDHTLEYEANKVCYERFYYYTTDPYTMQETQKGYDAWVYERLIKLHKDLKKIIEETDFSKQQIVLNASW